MMITFKEGIPDQLISISHYNTHSSGYNMSHVSTCQGPHKKGEKSPKIYTKILLFYDYFKLS